MAFRKKMASEEVQECYRRGRIVEFCHAWIKSKLGLRQFHVRGPEEGADGNAVGLLDLQPAVLDPPKQAAHNTSSYLRALEKSQEAKKAETLAK